MKNIKSAVIALVLSSVSFAGFAAQEVNSAPADQQKIGVISATGSSNLSSLENQLAVKAEAAGAKSFRITSTSGRNNLHGTAVIYN
ncbi:membrane protein [[Pantoea] beijingensis]|uniref:Membrane protein n=1 Tax=[Pantoea] beijingensis TaxID=1324864 RepID=A0A443IHK9_9GAMM|nr:MULTISPECIES: YdgH/BhsA/McbA-like domain containing protein [Erwiniaceae]RWR03644.1 membrane protein [[Pantoea] beijingensis]